MNILTIDIGTTSIRGILFGAAGDVLTQKSIHTELLIRGSWIEQSPEVYRNAALEICRSICGQFPVDAVSVTGFRSAVTLLNREGVPLCDFIMWQDRRNVPLCEELQPDSEEIRRRSGADLNSVFSATRILWLKRNRPELYREAWKVVIVPDYLVFLMTGVLATDHSCGSRTHLMDLETREWDDRMLEIFGLDREKLCPLLPPGSVVGAVTEAFGAESGLRPGTPVVTAGGDQQCSALGLGLVEPGSVAVNCGTGAFVLALTDQPEVSSRWICNAAAIPGKYILEANVLTGASALNWLRDLLLPGQEDGPEAFDQLNALAAASPPGAGGVYCLPCFQGCGAGDWDIPARAAFWGMTLSTTKGDLLRALYEGIAAEIARNLDRMPLLPESPVYASGGLSASGLYLQILSDMTGRKILRYSNAQATAIGGYVSAAAALGGVSYAEALQNVRRNGTRDVFTPCPETAAVYARYREESRRVFRALWGK